MTRLLLIGGLLLTLVDRSWAGEEYVSIMRVSGHRITMIPDSASGGRGMRRRGVPSSSNAVTGRRGRGRGTGGTAGAQPSPQSITLSVPQGTKITSALREQRTFEFRVGAELAGGLNHEVFRDLQRPLSAVSSEILAAVSLSALTPRFTIETKDNFRWT